MVEILHLMCLVDLYSVRGFDFSFWRWRWMNVNNCTPDATLSNDKRSNLREGDKQFEGKLGALGELGERVFDVTPLKKTRSMLQ